MTHVLAMLIIAAVPVLAVLIEWFGDNGIMERHHSHHDTYLVPRSIPSSLMLMMVFVGVLGLVVDWLCDVGVFHADDLVIGAFFSTFLSVVFILWLGIRRYRVTTTDDGLEVRNFVGSTRSVAYADITEMCRTHRRISNYPSIRVYAGRRSFFLWGLLDLDQILDRIDRYDVFSERRV